VNVLVNWREGEITASSRSVKRHRERPGKGITALTLRLTWVSSPTVKPNKKREQGDRSREEILDAAARLMAVRGFDGTSISALAKESGLPPGSIYWHFSSKVGVLNAVMERGAAQFFDAVALPEGPPAGERLERLSQAFERASDAIEAHPEFLRLLILLVLISPQGEANDSVLRLRQQGRARLHALIAYAYSDLGEQSAGVVADELSDFALAAWDGAFLASQTGSGPLRPIMDRLARSLLDQGDKIVAELELGASSPRVRRTSKSSAR
jgi:AcrR family transcriptional regulator